LERRRSGATIIPLIVSTDKTKLAQFRDKQAYPIYLTIGNIPKQIRRKVTSHAQILLGYIPVTKLTSIRGVTACRRALTNLFHACMQNALGPISSYGETGLDMKCGNGVWRRCHPIFASFVGDYPEQVLVTCTYNGRCPKCKVPLGQLGEYQTFPQRVQSAVIDTYQLCDGDIHAFNRSCRETGMKPVFHPFWENLPLTDIFLSITPDILHQMLQGMVKHLVAWVTRIFGASVINARCRIIPPNHHVKLFTNGITNLGRISGHEHKKICSILLGLIADLPVPGGLDSTRIIRAVRALMDFLFLAQYESHTSDTLSLLQDCLARFHENKQVFIDLGVRETFEFPKLHSLTHYASSIQLFGTTDNYNTEQTERLHIDLTKDAYRATNRKNEYAQMTKWLERREKVLQRVTFITQGQDGHQLSSPTRNHIGPPRTCPQRLKMARNPERRQVPFNILATEYGALDFQDMLAEFIAQLNHPGVSGGALQNHAHDTHIPFTRVPVFHKIKFTTSNTFNETEIADVVHVRPEQKDSRGRIIPARFDTILVETSKGQLDSVHTGNY
jgi:Plavaka transposase